jgi:hypothetical protein
MPDKRRPSPSLPCTTGAKRVRLAQDDAPLPALAVCIYFFLERASQS